MRLPQRLLPPRPSRADASLLPAILAAWLALMALAQAAMTGPVALPPMLSVAAGGRSAFLADPPGGGVPARLRDRPLFAPSAVTAGTGGSDGAAAPDPLGGYVFAGSIRVGRAVRAIVQTPDGAIRRVAPGARVAGWRLLAVGAEGVVLARGAERLRLGYGAGRAAGSGDDEAGDEQEDQP